MSLLVIFIVATLVRFLIPQIDLLLLVWLVNSPKNKDEEPQFIVYVLVSSIISSFVSDTPLGILPLCASIILFASLGLIPTLVNRGVDRTFIWFFLLITVILLSKLLSLLLTTTTLAISPAVLITLTITTVLSAFIRLVTRKRII